MTGRVLEFDVNKQRLMRKRDCEFTGIVAGSVGYLKAKFNFSEEWKGCKKVARFNSAERTEYAVELESDNTCYIPSEAIKGDRFYVAVIGGKSGYRISTNEIRVRQEVT